MPEIKDYIGLTLLIWGLKLIKRGVGLLSGEAFAQVTSDWDHLIKQAGVKPKSNKQDPPTFQVLK